MPTGKDPASKAGKGLRKPSTPKNQREVDASALAQAPRKKPIKKPRKKS